jgi:hypothetical protein
MTQDLTLFFACGIFAFKRTKKKPKIGNDSWHLDKGVGQTASGGPEQAGPDPLASEG